MKNKYQILLETLHRNMSDMLADTEGTAWVSEVLEMYVTIDQLLKEEEKSRTSAQMTATYTSPKGSVSVWNGGLDK
jgi:hypothetical protein